MTPEYASRGVGFVYTISDWEAEIICKAFAKEIKSLEKKIEKVRNHPKNEGQASYSIQIDEYRNDIKCLEENIKMLKPKKNVPSKNEQQL